MQNFKDNPRSIAYQKRFRIAALYVYIIIES